MQIGMYELLCKAQEMIARKYPTILTDKSKRGEIKNYIAQFLYDTGYTVDGYSMKQVTDRLFSEMAEYSFLTAYLNDPNIEEININGWDDVALTYTPYQDLPTKRNQTSHKKTLWLLPCDLTRISFVSVRCEIVKQALLLKQAPQTTPL